MTTDAHVRENSTRKIVGMRVVIYRRKNVVCNQKYTPAHHSERETVKTKKKKSGSLLSSLMT